MIMHLSRAHNTQRQQAAVKHFIFPVIFVVSVRQVARQVKEVRRSEGEEEKETFISSTLPPCNKKKTQLRIGTIFVIICTQRRSANVVFPRSTVCHRCLCEAPHPLLFLLLKGRTALSSTSTNFAPLLQLQVSNTEADMEHEQGCRKASKCSMSGTNPSILVLQQGSK